MQSALGNIPELLFGIFALRKGLVTVVQATLVGSILSNVLLVLGREGAGGQRHGARWPLWLALGLRAVSGGAAAFVSDWFATAITPALSALHISQAFAGLVIVAIAGNAVENVVGIQLAARNRMDYALSVTLQSPVQIALGIAPLLVLISAGLGGAQLTLVFPPLMVVALGLTAIIAILVVFDGDSTWVEGSCLAGLYVVIAAAFWWG